MMAMEAVSSAPVHRLRGGENVAAKLTEMGQVTVKAGVLLSVHELTNQHGFVVCGLPWSGSTVT